MRRREFIALVGGTAATWPLAARTQQPDRMRLIGVLMGYTESDRAAQSWLAAFRGGLTKLGVKRTLRGRVPMSAFDPNRTSKTRRFWIACKPESHLFSTETCSMALL